MTNNFSQVGVTSHDWGLAHINYNSQIYIECHAYSLLTDIDQILQSHNSTQWNTTKNLFESNTYSWGRVVSGVSFNRISFWEQVSFNRTVQFNDCITERSCHNSKLQRNISTDIWTWLTYLNIKFHTWHVSKYLCNVLGTILCFYYIFIPFTTCIRVFFFHRKK